MTHKGVLRVCRANLFIMSFGLAVTWWREEGLHGDCHSLFAHAAWFWYSCAVGITNQLHKWAHDGSRVPRAVRWLRRTGLVIAPSHHAAHHAPPYRRRYCITTGWSNLVIDRLGLFTMLEHGIVAVTRLVHASRKGAPSMKHSGAPPQ
jgi:hypothetical protein